MKINFLEMLLAMIVQATGTIRTSSRSVSESIQKLVDQNNKNQNQNRLTKEAKQRKKLVKQIIADLSPVLKKLHDYDTKN